MSKTLKLVLVAIVVIAIAGAYVFPQVQSQLGANPGPEFLNHLEFKQGYTKGGNLVATTSAVAAYTLAANEWRKETSYVSWTPNVNLTLTTMASTSAPLVGLRRGESFEILLYNASTTAASTITIAAGAGVDLQESEGGTVILNGLEFAKLTFTKKNDHDVALIFEGMQLGD